MTNREIQEYLYAFVKLCMGKAPTTDIEREVMAFTKSDEHLKQFLDVLRSVGRFLWKYRWGPFTVEQDFLCTTSSGFKVEIPAILRAKILSFPENATWVCREHFKNSEMLIRGEICMIYDQMKNLLWIGGLPDTTNFNNRMRAILYGLMINNGSAYKKLLPISIQRFEEKTNAPTMGSVDDTLVNLRKLLPEGFGIESENSWLKLIIPGEFLLIEYQD